MIQAGKVRRANSIIVVDSPKSTARANAVASSDECPGIEMLLSACRDLENSQERSRKLGLVNPPRSIRHPELSHRIPEQLSPADGDWDPVTDEQLLQQPAIIELQMVDCGASRRRSAT